MINMEITLEMFGTTLYQLQGSNTSMSYNGSERDQLVTQIQTQ